VPGRPEIPAKEFSAALGIEPTLVLPFDPKTFGQASNNGQMLHESAPSRKRRRVWVSSPRSSSRR
jgi:pilus assembly protein CpaE